MVDDHSNKLTVDITEPQTIQINRIDQARNNKRRKLENGVEEDQLQIADEEDISNNPEIPDKRETIQEEVMEEGGGHPPLNPPLHPRFTSPPPLSTPMFNPPPPLSHPHPPPLCLPQFNPPRSSPLQFQPTSAFNSLSSGPQLNNATVAQLNNAVVQAQLNNTAVSQINFNNVGSPIHLNNSVGAQLNNMIPAQSQLNNMIPAQSQLNSVSPGAPFNQFNNSTTVGMTAQALTAQALIENLFAQVLAHSITTGSPMVEVQEPITSVAHLNTDTLTTNIAQMEDEDKKPIIVHVALSPIPSTPSPITSAPPSVTLVPTTMSLQDTLDKVTIIEQKAEHLDKKSEGLKQLVNDVVRRQEEIQRPPNSVVCPRCRQTFEGVDLFVSHLQNIHMFSDRPPSDDFQSQAGLGTCRGWRYLRTRNSGTQTTLTMMVKPGDHTFIDLTEVPPAVQAAQGQNASEQLVQQQASQQAAALQQKQHTVLTPEPQTPLTPATTPQNQGLNYDSARATAAGLLSFVFGNPDLNKQFLNYAEGTKEEHKSPLLSPKKFGYTNSPITTPNMFIQQSPHNGISPMFERMKADQQKKMIQNSLPQQNKLMAQVMAQQQIVQQRVAQQSMINHPPSPLHPSPLHPSPIHPHSSVSHYSLPTPMSVTDLKGLEKLSQEYQNAANCLQKNAPVDVHSDSPLKDCCPKVRASLVNGDIQLMWNIIGDERKCTGYKLFAYMGSTLPPISAAWTEVGTVKALPMPMAVTLSQFSKGCSYHFTVRAIDAKGNCGPFSEPCSIKLSI